LLTAALLATYALTGIWWVMAVVGADYVIRVFTPFRSPLAHVACGVLGVIGVTPTPMNKGPKVFAWRVGFLMAAASLALVMFSPQASIIVTVALAGFNVLDGGLNYCVGCVIYTYVVLPAFGPSDV
jgi:hypothetical protein